MRGMQGTLSAGKVARSVMSSIRAPPSVPTPVEAPPLDCGRSAERCVTTASEETCARRSRRYWLSGEARGACIAARVASTSSRERTDSVSGGAAALPALSLLPARVPASSSSRARGSTLPLPGATRRSGRSSSSGSWRAIVCRLAGPARATAADSAASTTAAAAVSAPHESERLKRAHIASAIARENITGFKGKQGREKPKSSAEE